MTNGAVTAVEGKRSIDDCKTPSEDATEWAMDQVKKEKRSSGDRVGVEVRLRNFLYDFNFFARYVSVLTRTTTRSTEGPAQCSCDSDKGEGSFL